MVILDSIQSDVEAKLIVGCLATHGIEAKIISNTDAIRYGELSTLDIKIDIYVHEKDIDAARGILKSL